MTYTTNRCHYSLCMSEANVRHPLVSSFYVYAKSFSQLINRNKCDVNIAYFAIQDSGKYGEQPCGGANVLHISSLIFPSNKYN